MELARGLDMNHEVVPCTTMVNPRPCPQMSPKEAQRHVTECLCHFSTSLGTFQANFPVKK
ncbi:hypothetical protein DSO57_1033138 [Entomophthora muscae]|uniref:Uncharacterized protein n=1 Tax=Entomophthora muscae TaxID=34485 RepID=A0ACC2S2B8_9FUNG|nr:hypothetical protein DSO57_1033138 [Entomophthora muscae]